MEIVDENVVFGSSGERVEEIEGLGEGGFEMG